MPLTSQRVLLLSQLLQPMQQGLQLLQLHRLVIFRLTMTVTILLVRSLSFPLLKSVSLKNYFSLPRLLIVVVTVGLSHIVCARQAMGHHIIYGSPMEA